VPHLPETLSAAPNIIWEVPLAQPGLGGIAATRRHVMFGDRDLDDFHDIFRCLDAATGEILWEVERLAIAALDYGNSPRATPVIHGDRVYCQSAHGLLLCINLETGDVVWERDLRALYKPATDLPWGYCGSPLLVDGRLIVCPGSADASLVAFDPATGEALWKTPGAGPSYGSLMVGTLGGRRQIVGHDAISLGGWDIQTGERLWTVKPKTEGDFHVPTPIIHNDRLLVTTEHRGAQLFEFEANGQIRPTPVATNSKLRPDMSSPLVTQQRIYCVNRFLYCLDLDDNLNELWRIRDKAFGDYAAMFASDDRLLVIGSGELLLLPTNGAKKILARQEIFEEKLPIYSHPALVGNRLYVRGESKMICLEL